MTEELKRCIGIVERRIDLLYKLLRTDENGQQVDDDFIKGAICEAIQISRELKENTQSPNKSEFPKTFGNNSGNINKQVQTGSDTNIKQSTKSEILKDYEN